MTATKKATTTAKAARGTKPAKPRTDAAPPAKPPTKRTRGPSSATAGISEKILLNQGEAARLISVSVSTLETLLLRGDIRGLHVGVRHLVPRISLDAWVAKLLEEQTA